MALALVLAPTARLVTVRARSKGTAMATVVLVIGALCIAGQGVVLAADRQYEIASEDRERIFERGQRGLVAAKLGHIEGSGLGLWEARAIAVAHGGEISMRCDRTARRTRLGQAYHIVFAITIPLRQPKTGREARDAKRAEKAALFRR